MRNSSIFVLLACLVGMCCRSSVAQLVEITSSYRIGPTDTEITPTTGGAPVPLESAEIVVSGSGTQLIWNGRHRVESLTVQSGAAVVHDIGFSFDYAGDGSDVVNGLFVDATNVTVEAGGIVSGFDRSPDAPGPGTSDVNGGGASHGGRGGFGFFGGTPGPEYGSRERPDDFGSRGGRGTFFNALGFRGGGCVRIRARETLVNNGFIGANGRSQPPGTTPVPGSGGSVLIDAVAVSGDGTFQARGGNGHGRDGCGGGGRVAVYACDIGFDESQIDIPGGVQTGTFQPGSSGSSGTSVLELPTDPTFSTPASVQACVGGTALIEVGVSPGEVELRWLRNGIHLTDGATAQGSVVQGASTNELSISGFGPADEGIYTLEFVGLCATFSSDPIDVFIPDAVQQPLIAESDRVASEQDNVLFSVVNPQPGMAFRWELNGQPITDGVSPGGALISGALTSQLTVMNPTRFEAGQYAVEAFTSCGFQVSEPVILDVTCGPQFATTAAESGVQDGFASPEEQTSPRQALLDLLLARRPNRPFHVYDEIPGVSPGVSADSRLAHSFTGIPSEITAARLVIGLRGGGTMSNPDAVGNDAIRLGFAQLDGGDPASNTSDRIWERTFGGVAGDLDLGLLAGTLWESGTEAMIELDLSALPLDTPLGVPGATIDLLPEIIANGFLDVTVVDETAVDFMRLELTTPTPAYYAWAGPPSPDLTRRVGEQATFTAISAGVGGPFGYAWELNGVPIDVAANPTAESPTLVIDPVTSGDFGLYACRVSGALTCDEALSRPAELIRSDEPAPFIINSSLPITERTFAPNDPRLVARDVVVDNVAAIFNGPQRMSNLTIGSGGTIRHNSNFSYVDQTGEMVFGIDLDVAGNVFIAPGGSIEASGLGFPRGEGVSPGGNGAGTAGRAGGGGGHGGDGGGVDVFAPGPAGGPGQRGQTNGDLTEPAGFGSGGGNDPQNFPGGAGGGAVNLVVGGSLTLEGTIMANGGAGTVGFGRGGGGAGGTVNIRCSRIQGSGLIAARGGDGGSGGGGGRIAVRTNFLNINEDQFDARAGLGTSGALSSGGGGTIFIASRFRDSLGPDLGAPNVIVDNVGVGNAPSFTDLPLEAFSRGGLSPNLTFRGVTRSILAGQLFVNDLRLIDGAYLTHAITSSRSQIQGLYVQAAGDITIDASSLLDGNGRGFQRNQPGRTWDAGPGPGLFACGAFGSVSGGGHGGQGGFGGVGLGGAANDNAEQPILPGSGGGQCGPTTAAGGGVIRLFADGDAILDGTLRADGIVNGAGGTVIVSARSLSGSGTLSARGGSIFSTGSGSGGGGRIAVYSADESAWAGVLDAGGGPNAANQALSGSPGTARVIQSTGRVSNPLNKTVPVGRPATFAVFTDGNFVDPIFEWYRSFPTVGTFTRIENDPFVVGADSPNLVLADASMAGFDGVNRLYCRVSEAGDSSLFTVSDIAMLSVSSRLDINRDFLVDVMDIEALIVLLEAADPSSDFNEDGELNFFDAIDYLKEFDAAGSEA